MADGSLDTRRPCPLCAATAGSPGWQENGRRYVRCVRCRAFFSDLAESTYAELRHNAWDEDSPTPAADTFYGEERAAAHAAFLRRRRPWGGRQLLDVGCGLGYFLERAVAAGWEATGCDTSLTWSQLAARRTPAATVLHGGPDHPALDAERFDLITVWDVVEHVFDPVPFLRRIAELLRPGGRVFLRTPNLDYVLPVYTLRRRLGHPVELGPTNHVVYFDARSMRRALRGAGLVPEHWWTLPPPQVATYDVPAAVPIKNGWAAVCDVAARATRGRLVLGSDLDVLAGAAADLRFSP